MDNIESITGEINQLESQSQTAKDTLSSLAGKYNIEITGTETISEIQVDNIDAENDKLESQLAIKQKLLEYEQKEAAAATGTLAATETGATATTGGLSAALSGLWATLAPVLTAIVNNPLTWAIAIGAAAVAFYSSTNILPFQ